MRILPIIYIFFLSVCLFSCSDKEDKTSDNGSVIIEFDNRVGTTKLNLNTSDYPYTNALGQTFKVTTLKYYISNIQLTTTDGTVYKDPVSDDGSKGYYLIDESDPESVEITLENVPTGSYEELTFTIGVDANRVTEGAQTGALDVTHEMFWSWNAGYIFLKFEGASPQSTETDHLLAYHVGGYKSDPANANLANNIKEKTVHAHDGIAIGPGKQPEMHMVIDVLKFFESPNTIDFSTNANRHSPAACTDIADNYVNAFVLDHVHE